MRLDSLALLATTGGEMRGSLCRAIFCGADVENKRVRWVSTPIFFCCLLAKILNTCELGVCVVTSTPQNLERVGVKGKILWNKELALLP